MIIRFYDFIVIRDCRNDYPILRFFCSALVSANGLKNEIYSCVVRWFRKNRIIGRIGIIGESCQVDCECQRKFFYICIGKLLTSLSRLAGVNWKGETLTVHHSFSPFPLVPHAAALSYPVLVVLSTFVLH